MNIKSANQITDALGKAKTIIQHYMDDFPFKHYIIIKVKSFILFKGFE
jgi:hypothetical protein